MSHRLHRRSQLPWRKSVQLTLCVCGRWGVGGGGGEVCVCVCVAFLRRDGDLGVCVLLNFFQVASLLPDQASHKVVVSQDLQQNLIGSTTTEPEHLFSDDKHQQKPTNVKTQFLSFQTYVLVSLASCCMTSRIIRQAAEQPSGVEWMLMDFSAAPAFSLRCTSILK